MSLRAAAVLPWARSASRASCRAATIATRQRISSQRLPRTSVYQQLSRRSIQTTSSDRAEVTHTPGNDLFSHASPTETKTPQTLTEKIVQRHAVGLPEGKVVRSGDYVQIVPHRCMSHDNSAPIAAKFMSIGATKVADPNQLLLCLDHDVTNKSESNVKKMQFIETFAKQHGVEFREAGDGIGHQLMIEELFAWPGTLCVASDSHSNSYGGISAAGMAVVRTDAASIWATTKTWLQVPPVAKVTFTGTLSPDVTGKDVIIALCDVFQTDVLNHAVEFFGSEETMASIPIDDRITISNMSTEWSALSAMFPVDKTLENWLREKADQAATVKTQSGGSERVTHEKIDELYANPPRADPGAQYAKQLYLDLSSLVAPYISGPNSPKVAKPLHEVAAKNLKINKAYIISCTNARSTDFAKAAKVFKDAAKKNGGKIPKIADGVKLYIAAASRKEQAKAEAAGDWQALLEAGSIPLPASCGPCIGLGTGLMEDDEVAISASNRNFPGRIGSRVRTEAYLASPEIVAASALNGVISGTRTYDVPADYSGLKYGYGTGAPATAETELGNVLEQLESLIDRVESSAAEETSTTPILPGFPDKITGEILFCDVDNMNTDFIYPGKYTYQDGMTKEAMAKVCMENWDPNFGSIAKPFDILVTGENMGTGSSREQAATALLAREIPLVVASSFGSIFSRNSINNALLGVELPYLVERLRATFGADKVPTRRTGWTLTWDVKRSTVTVQEGENGPTWERKVGEFPENLQEIIARGGLTNWVKNEIAKTEAKAEA